MVLYKKKFNNLDMDYDLNKNSIQQAFFYDVYMIIKELRDVVRRYTSAGEYITDLSDYYIFDEMPAIAEILKIVKNVKKTHTAETSVYLRIVHLIRTLNININNDLYKLGIPAIKICYFKLNNDAIVLNDEDINNFVPNKYVELIINLPEKPNVR